VFRRLGDRAWLSRQPQDYVIGLGQGHPKKLGRPFQDGVAPGKSVAQTLFLAAPAGGWQSAGRLRIQARASLAESRWSATINGVALVPTADVSEPYTAPYAVGLGKSEDYRAWTVPVAILKEGPNRIELTLEAGKPTQVTYLDLSMK